MFSSNTSAANGAANYIEDVFSTYLYTGNGSTQTITNGIDLSTKGGLVWTKVRSASGAHVLTDTARGAGYGLVSSATTAQYFDNLQITGFNSNGYTLGADSSRGTVNFSSSYNYVSWTFRKQPKFFDVVTYTGDGTSGRAISHNLGSTPGCIIVKITSAVGTWPVFHRSLGGGGTTENLTLNTTAAVAGNAYFPAVSSTTFSVSASSAVNSSGATYVAYLFAHNAGGFGLTGTDNVISCGSYTGTGSTPLAVTLGYEPQWLLVKKSSGAASWYMQDVMRGMPISDYGANLFANLSNAEAANTWMYPTATGFAINDASANVNESGQTYIYIAIRRGPMKVPTDATKVFSPNQTSGTTGTPITTGFPVDWQLLGINDGNVYNQRSSTRLTGVNTDGSSNSQYLVTSNTIAEGATGSLTLNWNNTGFQVPSLNSGSPIITWNFGRAPSFFDEVCYTGTGSTPQTIAHNLGVAPELMIIKGRSLASSSWIVYAQPIWGTGIGGFSGFDLIQLNNNGNAGGNNKQINETAPTASVFSVGYSGSTYPNTNNPSDTFVAYLFGTCAGVSKIGKYTGTGTTLQIDCGFTSGARFVLIKRADSNGDWYVWDTARGIVSGNDPYLLLNSTAAEVTSTDYIDTYSAGFEISSTAPAAINASGGTYIFLAIA